MPELPEVETLKRELSKDLTGKTISHVRIRDTMIVSRQSPKKFIKRLVGKTVSEVSRRGKAIVISFRQGDHLIVQLAMTGQPNYGSALKTAKVVFELSNGQYLNYNDTRRFGRLSVIKDFDDSPFLQSLGPEPLGRDFNVKWLAKALQRRKSPIKSLLMNQSFLAGIGNIYASEILFRCGIHPQRPALSLKDNEITLLYQEIVGVLKEAIKFKGSSINTYRNTKGLKGTFHNRIQVYGKHLEKCPRCPFLIQRIFMAGRSTFFCPNCQPIRPFPAYPSTFARDGSREW